MEHDEKIIEDKADEILTPEYSRNVRSPEKRRDTFVGTIEEVLKKVRDHESIGAAVQEIAAEAFAAGLGKDEFANLLVSSDILKGEPLKAALYRCIEGEIEKAYQGRRGMRKMHGSEQEGANEFLAEELMTMLPHNTVSDIFRRILAGEVPDFQPITDTPSTTVSRDSFSSWAHKHTSEILSVFAKLMKQAARAQYVQLIEEKPQEYLVNFLPRAIEVNEESKTARVRDKNLEKIIVDVSASLHLEEFIGLIEVYLDEVVSIDTIIEVTERVKVLWNRLFTPPPGKPDSTGHTVQKRNIPVLPRQRTFEEPPPPLKADFHVVRETEQKMQVDILGMVEGKDRVERLASITIQKAPNQNKTVLRKYLEKILCGEQAAVRKALRSVGIRLNPEGPEIERAIEVISARIRKATAETTQKLTPKPRVDRQTGRRQHHR